MNTYFWTIVPEKTQDGKTGAADLRIIISEQENMEISYKVN
jgi:hypothetical protein